MAKQRSQGKALVIVESPAKARTIARYLGDGFVVESSIGHIRDLPSTAAEIPAEIKAEPWSRLGVNVNKDFQPIYIVPKDKKAHVRKLRSSLKSADELYLATDEDREGEAIAWHLTEVLEPKVPVKRMVFGEITKTAIQQAVHSTRDIDLRLVDAQETRRILDRLYGYEVSPVLWRKVRPKLSAGRVQSVATRLIVEREQARMRFVRAAYWDLDATMSTTPAGPADVTARAVELDRKRLATGKDFVDDTGQLKRDGQVVLLNREEAGKLAEGLGHATFTVADVAEKPFVNRPYAPFITSTLQQEAGRKLRFSAQRTMRLAQSLYENGYITYMRTDSTTLSTQAIEAARRQVGELYGQNYLPDHPRHYATKSKNAQEAHEAIRPAGESFRTPRDVAGELNEDQLKLYELIWKRTVASQMRDAVGTRTNVRIEAPTAQGTVTFTTSGKVIQFPGFLRAYVEGADDPAAELEDQEQVLPSLKVGQTLRPVTITPLEHETQPPARYTEASLIRELEERGIGRPSTYATIIETIQDRGYVFRKGTALVPTFTAFAVVKLLRQHLERLVDYDFTARMEDGLDAIANGQRDSTPWLRDFYFGDPGGTAIDDDHVAGVGLKALIASSGATIDARDVSSVLIGRTPDGKEIVVRVGRYGPYVQANGDDARANVPEDLPPDELTIAKALELLAQAEHADRSVGNDPQTGKPIYLKNGRFGPYVQLGDAPPKGTKAARGEKPKMASLWPGMKLETLTLDEALTLLSFPRTVGEHPENGEEITAQDGRYGPYLKMGTETRSLPSHEKLATVTLGEAVELFKQPKTRGRRGGSPQVLGELGPHPTSGALVQVKNGRFGPYVTDGVVNATVPRGRDPQKLTLAEGLELLRNREEKLRAEGKDPRAPKPAKGGRRKTARRRPMATTAE